MSREMKVAVFGASGFVGRATVDALRARGALVELVTSPRLQPISGDDVRSELIRCDSIVRDLVERISGVDAIVNAAGNPDASVTDEPSLMAPNALLPAVLATAVRRAAVPRFVHISSAVVQGSMPVLDQTERVAPFSAYSRSKVLGEQLVRQIAGSAAVAYRPPSVHAVDRRVSGLTAQLARSRMSSVARPGTSPTPQALLQNVADAVAFLATCDQRPPSIVSHPSEGLTTAGLLTLLGGRPPVEVPRAFARAVVLTLAFAGRMAPAFAANARRVELVWFGQGQAPSWLTAAGWTAPAGHDAWRELGHMLAAMKQK